MLRSILISVIGLFASVVLSAQTASTAPKSSKSMALGIDLAPFILKAFEPERTGATVVGRLGFNNKIFTSADVGFENIDLNNSVLYAETDRVLYDYNYQSDGSFIRLGLNYNIFKVDEPNNHDNILVGINYGFAMQEHNSSSYTIGNGYWDDYKGSASNTLVSTHWFELTFGLRAEILKNFYMGWAVRAKAIINSDNNGTIEPYAIPGFGKVENGLGFGFSYTLEYQIPFGKKVK